MIILAKRTGNHSNRLFQNINFEAFCKENGIEYINPSFYNLHKYYNEPCKLLKFTKGLLPLLSTFTKNDMLIKVLKKMKLLYIVTFDKETDNHILFSRQDIYAAGWWFRVPDLLEKYQDYFIKNYSLKEKYILNNPLLKIITRQRNSNRIIIGIHIRRTDYKTYQNGQNYFANNVYIKYMENIKNEISTKHNKECFFILFSDENVTISETPNIAISKNKWYIDQFLMSKCDLLIGPHSTFTLWASYIGKVKYFHINNDSGTISLDKFCYCTGSR